MPFLFCTYYPYPTVCVDRCPCSTFHFVTVTHLTCQDYRWPRCTMRCVHACPAPPLPHLCLLNTATRGVLPPCALLTGPFHILDRLRTLHLGSAVVPTHTRRIPLLYIMNTVCHPSPALASTTSNSGYILRGILHDNDWAYRLRVGLLDWLSLLIYIPISCMKYAFVSTWRLNSTTRCVSVVFVPQLHSAYCGCSPSGYKHEAHAPASRRDWAGGIVRVFCSMALLGVYAFAFCGRRMSFSGPLPCLTHRYACPLPPTILHPLTDIVIPLFVFSL